VDFVFDENRGLKKELILTKVNESLSF